MSKLTEETIRARTKKGDTPLHRAAKIGRIYEIPRHLLKIELFMAKNNSYETPIHIAARYGHLDQVPREFLTRETLTVSTEYPNKESRAGPTPPRTETPLHIAASCHADQIPKEFLTPEFLSLEATGYRLTVLHNLAHHDRLDLVPKIYANSEMWNLRDYHGTKPREVLEDKIHSEAYVAAVRIEPATEKQKQKLRYFGCAWTEDITKGQASDALDECVRRFPDVDSAYYNRPATEDQLAKLRVCLRPDGEKPEDYADEGQPLTYRQAKDLIWECEMEERTKERQEEHTYLNSEESQKEQEWSRLNVYWPGAVREVTPEEFDKVWDLVKSRKPGQPTPGDLVDAVKELFPEFRREPLKVVTILNSLDRHSPHNPPTEEQIKSLEGGLKLDRKAKISASKLDELLRLDGQPPRAEDMELFAQHGIEFYTGDAFAAYSFGDLVRCFESMVAEGGGYTNISMACVAASNDPAVQKATITLDQFDRFVFTWPKHKLKQWHREGAKY